MWDFLLSFVGGFFSQFWAQILAGLGVVGGVLLAYFKGKSDQEKKGQIATQKETIDAYQERDDVETRFRNATDDDREQLRDKWRRD